MISSAQAGRVRETVAPAARPPKANRRDVGAGAWRKLVVPPEQTKTTAIPAMAIAARSLDDDLRLEGALGLAAIAEAAEA
mmetsp:Transcript_129295/g.182293  ORF Transcript_129295/g.182293 Transcript_129295/m.182293 type:complete len:80 (-) Transcript_129295:38-277(-)